MDSSSFRLAEGILPCDEVDMSSVVGTTLDVPCELFVEPVSLGTPYTFAAMCDWTLHGYVVAIDHANRIATVQWDRALR